MNHIETEIDDNIQLDISGSARAVAELLAGLRHPFLNVHLNQSEPPHAGAAAGAVPQIGEMWPEQGGIYAGLSRGVDGQRDAHLILATDTPGGDRNWDDAMVWAPTIERAGHSDFRLPTRAESALLFANLRDQFEPKWHWTNEQSSRTYAWIQHFDDGLQLNLVKSYEGRARAVRRFIP